MVGGAHPVRGETPIAVVVFEQGANLDIGELRSWADHSLARYKLTTRLEMLDALPRNASGKVLKGESRTRAQ